MYQSLWKISFLVIFCIGCANNEKPSPLPYYNSPDFNPQFLIPPKANNLITHHIDKIDVVDQGGQPIITEDLKGKCH